MLKLNIIILGIYALERCLELFVTYRNKKLLETMYGKVELLDKRESIQMRFFHILWFLCLLTESLAHGQLYNGMFLYFIIFILVLAQILRWTCIFTLGTLWAVDVYKMDSHPVITTGPYAYIRHPNYLALVTEFFFLPFLLGSPITMVVGSVLNFFMLKRRIGMEEKALQEQSQGKDQSYKEKFKRKSRFIPLSHG
jgi:methyltransferase